MSQWQINSGWPSVCKADRSGCAKHVEYLTIWFKSDQNGGLLNTLLNWVFHLRVELWKGEKYWNGLFSFINLPALKWVVWHILFRRGQILVGITTWSFSHLWKWGNKFVWEHQRNKYMLKIIKWLRLVGTSGNVFELISIAPSGIEMAEKKNTNRLSALIQWESQWWWLQSNAK